MNLKTIEDQKIVSVVGYCLVLVPLAIDECCTTRTDDAASRYMYVCPLFTEVVQIVPYIEFSVFAITSLYNIQ